MSDDRFVVELAVVCCNYDCVAIVTNHSPIDYADLVRRSRVVADFRNATKGLEVDGKVWKL